MNFELTQEQQMIYEYGKNLSKTWTRDYWREKAEKREFTLEMWQQVGEDGFLGMMVPEEHGGAGLGMTEQLLLMEGMANEGIPLLMMVVGPTMTLSALASHGSDEQKKEFLPDGCSGKRIYCFAITEPNAGTNTIKATTVAKKKPDGRYSLSGTKTFITGVDVSDYVLVVARTTPYDQVKNKTDGFTLFLVDLKKKGIEKHPIDIAICLPEMQWTLFFDEVDLGPEDVLGEEGRGFEILFDSLNPERIIAAGMTAGIGRYALERAVEYASERTVFDAPIGSYQGVQHPLAMAKTEIELASLMGRKAAWQFDQGLPAGEASNMAKYAAAEAGIHAVDAAVQAHGGNGFTKEYGIFDLYPIVRLTRTAPINREIILSYIGEHVMGLPRSY
ncbi:MAG: acyl-CoA/acyl-ACP dehydrogenase [Gammaproteobacteria bacterium]|nr:acyl-CoA/acyl-ACP dehydrogenase [Gammaproteobacteria bacterium]